MAEEYWKTSPFGENSIFHPSWDAKQKQAKLQRYEGVKITEMKVTANYLPENSGLFSPQPTIIKSTNIVSSDSNFVTVAVKAIVNLSNRADQVKIALNKNSAITASKSIGNSFQYEANFNVKVGKSIPRIDQYGSQDFTFTATVIDIFTKEVSDTRSVKVKIDTDGKVQESSITEESSGIGNWFVNHKTGEYTWFDDKTKRDGFTRVGNYKLTYNKDKNIISAYAGKESVFIESIDMSKNNEDKFKTEQAAKFSLISAESGGGYVHSTDDPIIFPLIVGASIENRLTLYALGVTQYSPDGTIQTIKGYQAMSDKSYKDFKYGNNERFGLGESAYQKKNMNIGLSTVYLAVLGSIRYLNENYSVPKGKVKEFEQIIFYAHTPPPGKKNTLNGDFDVAIPDGTNGKYDYVRGQNKYKDKLKPNK